MTTSEKEVDIQSRIDILLTDLEESDKNAAISELSELVRLMMNENTQQKEQIRKLKEKDEKIHEILRKKLGLNI